MVIGTDKQFEAWKVKPIVINRWADFYNDTIIRMRREKIEPKKISTTELCWLAYARYLDIYVAPDDVIFDAGANAALAELANRWFGNDSVLLNQQELPIPSERSPLA